jgi:phosphate transport system protein
VRAEISTDELAPRFYAPPMRTTYQRQLEEMTDDLARMCAVVAAALGDATCALVKRDLHLAERAITRHDVVEVARASVENQAFGLLALQAPVATDLRIVVSAVHEATDIERMGGLAGHVARSVRRRYPYPVLPEELIGYFAEMGRIGVALAQRAGEVIRSRDLDAAAQLETDDNAMDELHRHMFTVMMRPDWPHGIPAAVDATLLARFYERYADHAVAVARRVIYVITARMPEPPSM